MQGTRLWSLVWEDSTCHRATKPVCHNYWSLGSGTREPQLLSPRAATTEPMFHNKRSHHNEKPQQRVAPFTSTRESLYTAMESQHNQKFMLIYLAFTHLTIFLVSSLLFRVLRILVSEIIFKYNDKCESWIITLNKWGHGGEISRSELWLKAILETY